MAVLRLISEQIIKKGDGCLEYPRRCIRHPNLLYYAGGYAARFLAGRSHRHERTWSKFQEII